MVLMTEHAIGSANALRIVALRTDLLAREKHIGRGRACSSLMTFGTSERKVTPVIEFSFH